MPSTLAGSDVDVFGASYYDGRTAQRHAVSVRLRDAALDVVADDDQVLDQWLFTELSLSDQGSAGTRVVKQGSEARLLIADPAAFTRLQALCPHLHSDRQRTLRNMGLSVAATVAIIVIGYFSLPWVSGGIVAMIPLETESRIGDTYADQVAAVFSPDKEVSLCQAGAGMRALDRVVAHLSQFTDGPFDYRVDVLDTPLVNAVALPGGRILLFRGVLDKAETLDEVAGVIAHEMEHVNQRHGMQAVVRSYGINILADMMFGGSMMGSASQVVMMTSYSRDAETAADEGAIRILNDAGIGTAGLARFFARLSGAESDSAFGMPELLSTHPASDVREALALEQAQPGAWTLTDNQWRALKDICKD